MTIERYLLPEMIGYISKVACAVNTIPTTLASYTKFLCDMFQPPIPDVPLIPDGQIGGGSERPRNYRPGWVDPLAFNISGRVNTHITARLGSRCLGGEVSSNAVTAAASYDITTLTQRGSEGRLPKFSAIGFLVGGYDYILNLAVDSMELSFEGDRNVDYTAAVRGTGYHKRAVADIAAVIPANVSGSELDAYHLMHPAGVVVTFTDGTPATIDFGADGDLLAGRCSLGQGISINPLPNDSFMDAADWYTGAYARDIHRTSRVPVASLDVAVRSDLADFILTQRKKDVTNLIFKFRSADKIGVTTERYEFEWKYPVARLGRVASNPKGDVAAVSMTFEGKPDATDGFVIQRVRTDLPTIS
ncbi:MAG TPA: hypothetical protein VF708_19990 [Pyrinomonadaceae bacterium]|jgi:hypothetical protein